MAAKRRRGSKHLTFCALCAFSRLFFLPDFELGASFGFRYSDLRLAMACQLLSHFQRMAPNEDSLRFQSRKGRWLASVPIRRDTHCLFFGHKLICIRPPI